MEQIGSTYLQLEELDKAGFIKLTLYFSEQLSFMKGRMSFFAVNNNNNNNKSEISGKNLTYKWANDLKSLFI